MKIDELRSYAEENGFDSIKFEFTNLVGTIKTCRWLDAYFGLFVVDGTNGFITVEQWKELTDDVFDFRLIDS